MSENCAVPRSGTVAASEPHHGNQSAFDPEKPICSYSCLIGMALRRGDSNSLSVNDIYKNLQEEFPYFKTANSIAWKNSVRHCLSLGQYFRKVEQGESREPQSRKCFHWEVIPAKKEALEREINKYVSAGREEKAESEEIHYDTTGSGCYQTEQGTDGHSYRLTPQLTTSAHSHSPLPQQSTNESILANPNVVVSPGSRSNDSNHTSAANWQNFDNRLQYSTAGHWPESLAYAAQYQSHNIATSSMRQQAYPPVLDSIESSGIQKALLEIFAEIYNQAHPGENMHLPPPISPSGSSECWHSESYRSFLTLPQHITTQQGNTGYTEDSEVLPGCENSHVTGNFTDVLVGSTCNLQSVQNHDPSLDSYSCDSFSGSALADSLDPCPFCDSQACTCQHHDDCQQDGTFDWLESSRSLLELDPAYPASVLEIFDSHLVNEILEERSAQCFYDSFLPLCTTDTKPAATLYEASTSNAEELKQSTTEVSMHLRIEATSKRVLSDCISALEGGNSFQGRTEKKKEVTPVNSFYCNVKDSLLDMSFYRTPSLRLDDPLIGSFWNEPVLEQSDTLITQSGVQNGDEQMLVEQELVAGIFNVQ